MVITHPSDQINYKRNQKSIDPNTFEGTAEKNKMERLKNNCIIKSAAGLIKQNPFQTNAQ